VEIFSGHLRVLIELFTKLLKKLFCLLKMSIFSAKKISDDAELAASELVRVRQEKGLTLENATQALGLKAEYLLLIEKGAWSELPPGVYRRNYIKIYADWLGFDGAALARLGEDQGGVKFSGRLFHRPYVRTAAWEISRLLKIALLAVLILACFIYLGFYLETVFAPPRLELISPAENLVIASRTIIVAGRLEPEATLSINGEAVLADQEGNFQKEISLKSGVNTITIKARKKFGREQVVVRKILVEN